VLVAGFEPPLVVLLFVEHLRRPPSSVGHDKPARAEIW
jgi:hypothetical protein